MLNFGQTLISRSVERPLVANVVLGAEGSALVWSIIDGQPGVRPSSGVAGEKFAGVSLSDIIDTAVLPHADVYEVKDSSITLNHAPLGGSLRIETLQGVVFTAYNLSDRTVTFTASPGQYVNVYYRYTPTILEVKALQGDEPPGRAASFLLNTVGVIEIGDVYTTEYDTAADWSGEFPVVKLGPNGMFTTAGSGTEINAVVIKLPQAGDPYLGLRVSI